MNNFLSVIFCNVTKYVRRPGRYVSSNRYENRNVIYFTYWTRVIDLCIHYNRRDYISAKSHGNHFSATKHKRTTRYCRALSVRENTIFRQGSPGPSRLIYIFLRTVLRTFRIQIQLEISNTLNALSPMFCTPANPTESQ